MSEIIVRFNNVSFEFNHNRQLLHEVSFSIRSGMKITLMGQNGAGKSTLFKLITRELKPESGEIAVNNQMKVATAHQVMKREDTELTMEEFFHKYCPVEQHELRKKISEVLDIVNLKADHSQMMSSFSGGQQARLLLAAALIQDPDLLLLDEPTNNLDYSGIEHLTTFLINYKKSCLVISHDANFLNSFTDGVLYLDVHTQKMEQYSGNYYDVVEQISAQIEKENQQNARMAKGIQENKEKANFFAHKGGKMRLVAKKMREKAEEMEEQKVDVRKEDKTIRKFEIPVQENIQGAICRIKHFTVMQNYEVINKTANILLSKDTHLLITGPNGIGKSTLIESIANGTATGGEIQPGIQVGYYRQDFSTLDFDDTVYQSLINAMLSSKKPITEEEMRAIASGFLITNKHMHTRVGDISEGQKGLLSFARLVLQKPGLLILDEPTNHINFRHLPIIAQALDKYKGAMIMITHVPEFMMEVRIDEVLDLER